MRRVYTGPCLQPFAVLSCRPRAPGALPREGSVGTVGVITVNQVRRVAELARIDLAAGEEERLTGQLNAILEYMDQLGEVDTTGIEPTSHVLPLTNVLRDDEPRLCLPNAEALANAPAADQGHFAVPKIIE